MSKETYVGNGLWKQEAPDWSLYQQSFNKKEDYERQLKIQRDLGLMPPADRHPDVRFRGKSLTALSPEETFEALQQAITHLKALTLGGSDFSGIR